ncbi:MAG: helix-turn-helix domain containing protein, partial [Elusimicrobiota bacterium]
MGRCDNRRKRYSADYKLELVKLAKRGYNKEQISKLSGIPRTTINDWVNRYDERGAEGLINRRQWSSVELIKKPPAVIDKILQLKSEHPAFGSQKISGY